MMKKTYKSSLLALSVLASFTSCSESESLQQANLSKDKITFHATLDNSWKPLSPASSSRAAIAAATEKGPIVVSTPFGKPLYLHPVVQDGIHIWSKEGKPITRSGAPLEDVEHERVAQTRGTMSTKTDLSDYNSFGVTAIYKEGDTYQSLFANAEATKSAVDGFWGIDDKDKAQWPIDGIVSFHAYAPYNTKSSNMLTLTAEPEKVQSKITYTASAGDIINQPDLIVATSTGSRNNPGQDDAVNLQFSHALTAVSFAISKDLVEVIGAGNQLVSLSLEGVYTQGDCELAAKDAEHSDALLKWTGTSDNTGKYEFDLTDKNIIIDENLKDMALTEDNQTLMMIPQTLTADAKLKFEFKLNGVPQFLSISMDKQEWLPGTSVIYKLSASAINSLTNTEVVYPSTWNAVGYPKQAFAKDEAIGLFAVSQDKRITAKNVKLVKQIEDGNEIWKTSDGNKFLRTANYKYFAYYPYDANLSETDLDVNAETADAFFAKKITNWNPVKEQKTKEVLLRQDLQVAEGVIDGDASTLTFNMAHSMGLAVLNLKAKMVPVKRTFTTNNYTYYFPKFEGRVTTKPETTEYTDATEKMTIGVSKNFEGNIPYLASPTESRYMQIVKPVTDVAFKAAETSVDKRDSWGILEKDKNTFNVAKNSVSAKDITADAEFYNFSRYYTLKKEVETFTAPEDGDCKLECWGASGGFNEFVKNEGKGGGYTYGSLKNVEKGKQLFVCVGGQGGTGKRNQENAPGGYNGGGNGGYGVKNEKGQLLYGGCGGGGATHIAFKTGVLKEFANSYSENLLMVAGGSAGYSNIKTTNTDAAYGGGLEGGWAYNQNDQKKYKRAGQNPDNGMFGQGQDGRNGTTKTTCGGEGNSGGGGGFCGGYSNPVTGNNTNAIGGGGSGYVNSTFLVDAKTTPGNTTFSSPTGTKEFGHQGDGAAVISWFVKEPSTTK
ncbi:hypothetical protein F7D57_00900 [Prevotella copri]|uniref:receptor protein-tyrosine kinase n=1 Tax=Segatella copri TaxID=165179 RepID=A0AA91A444_9BACT|nr:fimbrillin family protein [Segatella copri]MQO08301.1 hypothetical protein [Segatella copri]